MLLKTLTLYLVMFVSMEVLALLYSTFLFHHEWQFVFDGVQHTFHIGLL